MIKKAVSKKSLDDKIPRVRIGMKIMVTLKDIAIKTGLSVGAVSQLLNTTDSRYSAATKARVEQVAREMGYRPNRSAQYLRKKKSKTIAVVNFGSLHQLTTQRLYAVVKAIHEREYRPLIYDVSWIGDDVKPGELIDAHVEGVVLVNPTSIYPAGKVSELVGAGVPVVSIGGFSLPGIPKYLADKEHGFYTITKHLLSLGYMKIDYLGTMIPNKCNRKYAWHTVGALNGFKRATDEFKQTHAVDAHVELVTSLDNSTDKGNYNHGYLAMGQLLDKRSPRAVVCSNDSWALGGMRACVERGLRIPEDIAITGFEDELAGRYGAVPLTTVAHPLEEIADKAVAQLFDFIKKGITQMQDELKIIRGKLIVRRSCGAYLQQSAGLNRQ